MNYYCVGFQWDMQNQLPRFTQNGIWENGYEDKLLHTVNKVEVGSRIAAKTTFTRKENGKTISVLRVHALGTVTKNEKDGHRLIVEWDKDFKPFDLDGRGAYRTTISRVNDPNNIRLIFDKEGGQHNPAGQERALDFDQADFADGFTPNLILYGPPGTGKTYRTISKAVSVAESLKEERLYRRFGSRTEVKDRFDELVIEDWDNTGDGQIAFVTFHQSMSYEDFIEGIKPVVNENDEIIYDVEPGIFKKIAGLALSNWLDAKAGQKGKLSFEDVFEMLKDDWEENPAMKFSMKTAGKEFSVTGFTKSSIRFKKANGGTDHTLSIGTLRDYYYQRKTVRATGVGIYYPGLLEKLRSFKVEAVEEKELKNYVLIIDEINRGNISQIFGELITLIEEDKRLGNEECLVVTLPYSKEKLLLPPNLYIIGTMNSADRSVEALDTALRRRFVFEELMPDPALLTPARMLWQFWWDNEEYDWNDKSFSQKESPFYQLIGFPEALSSEDEKDKYWGPMKNDGKASANQVEAIAPLVAQFQGGINLSRLLEAINNRIEKLIGRDYLIGHAYFINIRSIAELKVAFFNKVIPLLQEYFFRDYGRIGLVIGMAFLEETARKTIGLMPVPGYDTSEFNEGRIYKLKGVSHFASDDDFKTAITAIYA